MEAGEQQLVMLPGWRDKCLLSYAGRAELSELGKQQLQPSAAEQHYPAACLASIVGMFGFECWFPHGRERKHFFHAGKGWRRVKLRENISAWDIYTYAYTYTSEKGDL